MMVVVKGWLFDSDWLFDQDWLCVCSVVVVATNIINETEFDSYVINTKLDNSWHEMCLGECVMKPQ